MIIAPRAKVTDMAVICLVADEIFKAHNCVATLEVCRESKLVWRTRELFASERESLLRELVASLGAGVTVTWNARSERIEVIPKDLTS